MNVYEAIKASPIGVAWHKGSGIVTAEDGLVAYCAGQHPDGWQPLAVLEQYTLGEPLTEGEYDMLDGEARVICKSSDGTFRQGTKKNHMWVEGCRYADPRPLPTLPEPKEEPKLIHEFYEGNYCLTDEGRRRLERLLK